VVWPPGQCPLPVDKAIQRPPHRQRACQSWMDLSLATDSTWRFEASVKAEGTW
jgi:hypothetical protein